ncbi:MULTISPECIES: hypothetical protein [unclassified Chryseobacterium]|uniref:hypothetical protein n=1 Tax=unclassified Chryseobacterium TaxID=2593645 RepID=UPI00301A9523
MKFRITLKAEVIVEFDENSEEFKEIFHGYKDAIDGSANLESLSESIASHVSRYGTREFIEGVGYLNVNSENQTVFNNGKYEEIESPINIEVETDLNGRVDFEIEYTEEI